MFKTIITVAALMGLATSAQAFEIKGSGAISKAKTQATAGGNAGSESGVIGGSAILGATNIVAGNVSTSASGVEAKNTKNSSIVNRADVTTSTSALQSQSAGLAGSVGGAGGGSYAESYGNAKKVGLSGEFKVKVKGY